MSYLDDLLGNGEAVLFSSRQHWFVLFARVLAELLFLAILGVTAFLSVRYLQPNGQYILWIAGAVALVLVLSGLGDVLRWSSEQYIVTDRRVIQIEGVLSKNCLDSSLEKINDVQLQQSLFGRIFDYGTIEILTASEEAVNRMEAIAHPIEFKRAMQEARARYDGYLDHGEVRAYAQGSHDVQGVLEQLASLRDRGILSDAEFEAKKRDVLSRI